jgi:hypothetical protein
MSSDAPSIGWTQRVLRSLLQASRHLIKVLSRRSQDVLVYGFVTAGVALQLRQYLANKSLSLDESFLALNIINRPFTALFHPLDFNQGAPPVFLAVQKIVETTFGSREYSLRLVPLIAACTAIGVFPFLARQVLDRRAVPVGVALFVLSDPLIRYSSTNKQYSTDVAMVVLIYWLIMRYRHRLDEPLVVSSLATFAAFAPWLSFPSLLIVLGVSTTLAGRVLATRSWRTGVPGFAIGGACLLSLVAVYFIAVRQLSHLQASFGGNTSAYLGGSSGSLDVMATAGKLRYVAGISHLAVFGFDIEKAVALAVTCFCLIGFAGLFRRDREMVVILVSPVPFLILAAFAQKYPLLSRTLLFLLPVIVLLLAQGIIVAMSAARRLLWRALILLAAVAIGISIANQPLQHLLAPRTEEEMKPVMTYLARHQRATDALYIYYPSPYGFRYYLQCSCAPDTIKLAYSRGLWPAQFAPGGRAQYAPAIHSTPPNFLIAKFRDRDPHSYVPDLKRLRGRRRVWILYSDIPTDKRRILLDELNHFGSRKASFRGGPDESSAVVQLYDFAH